MTKRLFCSLAALLFFLIFSLQLTAQCKSGDCKNGKGTYIFPSGAKYTGDFRNGECHGIGVCFYTDGSKYSGEWRDRYPEGKGTKTYVDGTKRTGNWRKGKPVDENGNLLDDFIAKKKEERQDDGTNIQSGCLSGDCKNGSGVFAYPDGSKYEGQFLGGKSDGWGRNESIIVPCQQCPTHHSWRHPRSDLRHCSRHQSILVPATLRLERSLECF